MPRSHSADAHGCSRTSLTTLLVELERVNGLLRNAGIAPGPTATYGVPHQPRGPGELPLPRGLPAEPSATSEHVVAPTGPPATLGALATASGIAATTADPDLEPMDETMVRKRPRSPSPPAAGTTEGRRARPGRELRGASEQGAEDHVAMDRPAAYHGSSGLSITGGAEGASSAFRPSLPSEGAPSDAEAAPSLGHSEEQPPGGGEEVPGGPSSPSPRQTEGRPSSGREGEAVVVSPADTRRGEKPLSVYTAPQSAQHPARGDGCDPEAACDLVPWRLQTTKAQRRRSAALAGAAAAVRVPEDIQGTVLFRPAQRGTTFTRDQGWELAEELGSRPGVLAVRVNTRRGVVAADVGSDAALRELLAMSVIRGVAVSAREPATRNHCSGLVFGVDGRRTVEQLLAATESAVPIVSASLTDSTLTVRFAAPTPPAHISIHRRRLAVRPCRPRPLQCGKCGGLGHITGACRAPVRCIRCGGPHDQGACSSRKPRCINCGGPHAASDPMCHHWQRERHVATLLATSQVPLSRRAVRGVVAAETATQGPPQRPTTSPAALSYAQVVKGGRSNRSQQPPQRDRQKPGPRASRQAPKRAPAAKAPGQPPDARDREISQLRLALRALSSLLPEGSEGRRACLEAAGSPPLDADNHG
ncbi:hypothetical protein V5799_012902 [Amblyomma americanum]|uniref:CCHC-type domain-containing protein n=1 Tax=Amblyomma americanum TaxID=6943 RepID=A0AAQ4E7M7_AMBAM